MIDGLVRFVEKKFAIAIPETTPLSLLRAIEEEMQMFECLEDSEISFEDMKNCHDSIVRALKPVWVRESRA